MGNVGGVHDPSARTGVGCTTMINNYCTMHGVQEYQTNVNVRYCACVVNITGTTAFGTYLNLSLLQRSEAFT